MKEKDLMVFINGSISYFNEIGHEKAEMGVPYLKSEKIILDYTGVIGISGAMKGGVYFTSSRQMLEELIKIILEEDAITDEMIVDFVGEIANTISGNARKEFGEDFMISIPIVIEGKPRDVKLPLEIPSYVIPIKWKSYQSYLVIGIE